MKTVLLTLGITFCVMMAGCSFLDAIAPPQYNEQGEAIPGSRQPTEVTQAVADTVPYGNVALGVLLLFTAGYEKFRAYKNGKGLKATLLAGKRASQDPELKKAWEEIKEKYYKQAHEDSGVTSLVKILLAKL